MYFGLQKQKAIKTIILFTAFEYEWMGLYMYTASSASCIDSLYSKGRRKKRQIADAITIHVACCKTDRFHLCLADGAVSWGGLWLSLGSWFIKSRKKQLILNNRTGDG